MVTQLDHLVVTAADLDSGCAWVHAVLGVTPGPGGSHEAMATHNRLLRLGDLVYLEVIAPHPEAAPAARPRWFGMDVAHRLTSPRLATWVARTDSMARLLPLLPVQPGPIHPMRRGEWHWRISIPDDGEPLMSGVLPTLIEWPDDRHPAQGLPESGCKLLLLELKHPDEAKLKAQCQALALGGEVPVHCTTASGAPGLRAVIATPLGERVLEGEWPN